MKEAIAGDAWLEYIKQFPKLEELFNSIPEPLNCLLRQQIDIFAGKYPVGKILDSEASGNDAVDVLKEIMASYDRYHHLLNFDVNKVRQFLLNKDQSTTSSSK